MAIKPTIFKAQVDLSDLNEHRYESMQLTIAQHPSETPERMMVRLLAYCLEYGDDISFTKGLSATDEPDIWQHSLDGRILNWIMVGQPDPEFLKKSANKADKVTVYAFGSSAPVWWQKHQSVLSRNEKLSLYSFDAEQVEALNSIVERTMKLSILIQDEQIHINNGTESIALDLTKLL